MRPGRSTPTMIELASIVSPARPRIGVDELASKAALGGRVEDQLLPLQPEHPAVIEPPETLETAPAPEPAGLVEPPERADVEDHGAIAAARKAEAAASSSLLVAGRSSSETTGERASASIPPGSGTVHPPSPRGLGSRARFDPGAGRPVHRGHPTPSLRPWDSPWSWPDDPTRDPKSRPIHLSASLRAPCLHRVEEGVQLDRPRGCAWPPHRGRDGIPGAPRAPGAQSHSADERLRTRHRLPVGTAAGQHRTVDRHLSGVSRVRAGRRSPSPRGAGPRRQPSLGGLGATAHGSGPSSGSKARSG